MKNYVFSCEEITFLSCWFRILKICRRDGYRYILGIYYLVPGTGSDVYDLHTKICLKDIFVSLSFFLICKQSEDKYIIFVLVKSHIYRII